MDLRERRRIETRDLIQRSAFNLARANGLEAVTIDAICDAAGISQRTFFNYFPFKEAVFVVTAVPLPEAARRAFLLSTGDLMHDLAELMAAHAVEMQRGRWFADMIHQIPAVYPKVMPLQMAAFQDFDRQIKDVIAERLGLPEDDPTCMGLAGAVLGANRHVVDRARNDPTIDLPAAIRDGILNLARIIRATRIDREPDD